MKFQSKEFKELLKQWNQKLKDSGFVDAQAKRWSGNPYTWDDRHGAATVTAEAKRRYFELLCQGYEGEEEFLKADDEMILKLASEGYSPSEIGKVVGKNRKTIRLVVRRYEHKWGIRQWTRKQMYMLPTK